MHTGNRDVRRLHRTSAYRSVVSRWDGRLCVACSGGVDSSALLLLAIEARNRQRIPEFVAVYIDHQTRAETLSEASVVAETCSTFKVPFVVTSIDTSVMANQRERMMEDELREGRYAALAATCRAVGASGVVTAHTRNDQVETILMRLFSGAGTLATAGMRAVRTIETRHGPLKVVRPLLDTERSTLADIVDRAGIATVYDRTNDDDRYRRNRIRNRVIPEIEATFPGFQKSLLRSAEIARRDAEAMDNAATRELASILHVTGDSISLERDALRRLSPGVSHRILRMAALQLICTDARELTFERIESIRTALSGRTGATFELPYGVMVRIDRSRVAYYRRSAPSDEMED